MAIISRTPVRISFGGGGTDLASYYEKYGGLVVSAAINKYFYTILELREDNRIQLISADLQLSQTVEDFYDLKFGEGFDIPTAVIKHFNIQRGMNLFLASEVPPGTGLGSSGALAVNTVNILNHLERKGMGKQEIAETAYSIGFNDLKLPIGKQDEYASAFGGINFIRFEKDNVEVEPLKLSNEIKKRMEDDILLFFTGKTRESSEILNVQNRLCREDDSRTIETLHVLKKLGGEMKIAVEKGDLRHFGELMHESWMKKKDLVKGITNETIDKVYNTALKYGATGGKILGAGGGGYLLFYCEQGYQKNVRNALHDKGFKELDLKFDMKGTTILGEW
jgi:D-glycero-alpha-D-manno-heptose-7-phosphate kinase